MNNARQAHWHKWLLLAVLALFFHMPAWAQQVSTYDTASGNLSIPLIYKDKVPYTNAVLQLTANGGWSFTSPGSTTALTTQTGATYDTTKATLTVPYVYIDGSYYYNVILSLPAGKNWSVLSFGSFNQLQSVVSTLSFPIVTTVDNMYATDTGGVMSYVLNNGQVWRIVTDDPCFPPLTVPTGAPPAGNSNVLIYPNPDNGTANYLMIISYGGAEESCIIEPVSVPGIEVTRTSQPFSTSVSTLTAAPGKFADFYVYGGTKPYFLYVDNPGVASVQLLNTDGAGQAVRVTMNTPGTANLSVFDYNRLMKTVALTAQSDLWLSLSDISVSTDTPSLNVFIRGGVPPYTVLNTSPSIVKVSAPTAIDATWSMITLSFLSSSGGKMPIEVFDSVGGLAVVTVTVSAGSSSSSGGSSGSSGSGSSTGSSGSTIGGGTGSGKPPLK